MDWDKKQIERQREIEEEKKRLMAMSDREAESLPVPDRYQRLRYIHEKQAHEWLMDLRRTMQPYEPAKEKKRQPSNGDVIRYRKWED